LAQASRLSSLGPLARGHLMARTPRERIHPLSCRQRSTA
jgi:hypothetical protein